MADAPVFYIANFDIHDADKYRAYEEGFFPMLKKHGGSFITYDDASETIEGSSPRTGRIVLFQFPNEAAAKAWYADPEYQALAEHRRAGTHLHFLTRIHGMLPRS